MVAPNSLYCGLSISVRLFHQEDTWGVVKLVNVKRRRGFGRERMLARKLWEKGFAVLRAPASGAKARRLKYPDMVALRNGVIIVLEIKTSERAKPIYISREQVEKLREFTRRAGGAAFIAVDYVGSGLGWRFIPVEMLEETRGGNYRVSPEVVERALRLGDLVRLTDKSVGLDAFMAERNSLDEA